MALSVNTNIPSQTAQLGLERSQDALDTSMRRLATGNRINSAKDDAAGLQISNRLGSQVDGLAVAVRNANDGISIAQTAEGAMGESTAILQRLRDLSLQSANDSNDASDRLALNRESQQLIAELDRISETTTFGGQKLLDGSFKDKHMQVGANANEIINITVSSVNSSDLGINSKNELAFAGFDLDGAAGIADQTLTISVAGKPSEVAIKSSDSAKMIAERITSSIPDISAKAKTTVSVTFGGISAGNLDFTINGDTTSTAFATDVNTTVENLSDALAGKGYDVDKSVAGVITITNDAGSDLSLNAQGTSLTASAQSRNFDNSGDVGVAANIVTGTQVVKGDLSFNTTNSKATYSLSSTGPLASSAITGTVGAEIEPAKSVKSINITSYDGAQSSIPVLDAAIADIDNERGTLGAIQNRFQYTIYNLQSIRENVVASRGRIKDTDYAAEMSELTRQEVLKQASMTNLARANNMQKDVLYLLN